MTVVCIKLSQSLMPSTTFQPYSSTLAKRTKILTNINSYSYWEISIILQQHNINNLKNDDDDDDEGKVYQCMRCSASNEYCINTVLKYNTETSSDSSSNLALSSLSYVSLPFNRMWVGVVCFVSSYFFLRFLRGLQVTNWLAPCCKQGLSVDDPLLSSAASCLTMSTELAIHVHMRHRLTSAH